MEILFVSHKYPPAVGGMEKQSYELINGMSRLAKVHSLVYCGKESRIRFFISLEKRISQILIRFPAIRIIHFNDALIASVCLRHKSYCHLYRTVTVHGLDIVFPSRIYQKHILPAFNRFDLIIAVSQATAKACIERGIRQEKVVVIPNGVDHNLLKTQPSTDFSDTCKETYGIDLKGKTVFLALGRPVKRKGLSWFLAHVVPLLTGNFIFLIVGPYHQSRPVMDWLFSCLPDKTQQLLALFLGYPNDENRIRALLCQSGFENKAVHLGKLRFDDLIQMLASVDALVMPNIRVEGDMEGFGLVGLEASLSGAWVFASAIDGIPDAIHPDHNGTLLPPKNEKVWAGILNDYIAAPNHTQVLREKSGTYTAAHFSWDKMTAAYLENFHQLQKSTTGRQKAKIPTD
jgi:glycosyltransferase involved in cell wall biosynthesis